MPRQTWYQIDPHDFPDFFQYIKNTNVLQNAREFKFHSSKEEITPANIADNFDERTVINDDLNMNGYFKNNLKDPEDDRDATTKDIR